MLTIFINKILFICNKLTKPTLPNITKYRYPIHIKKLLNKFPHLHNIICDENSRMNCRLPILMLISKYKNILRNIILIWNLRFYLPIITLFKKKFINMKLHSSPLYNAIENSISSSDFDKASCLSHQYSYVFNKSYNINIGYINLL